MSAAVWLAVAGVGGAGAVARSLVDRAVVRRIGRGLPSGTLVVNLSGSLVLGLLTGLGLDGDALLVAGTATIGSYTTFSTWMLESQRLGEGGEGRRAFANLLAGLLLGLGAAALGRLIGGAL
jgi:fluoride exporter